MSLRFYNTLSRTVEEFKPINPGQVGLYTCGPTVYDYAHIGNFRSYMFEDVVKRYLLYRGYRVQHIMNITDIDDKTIRKANEQKSDLRTVTDFYIAAFEQDRDTLAILPAEAYPRATEYIAEMIAIIEKLLAAGIAYVKDGSVYFSIAKFPSYGRLANLDQDKLQAGVSVDADEYEKDAVQDFVLWKGQRAGEPFWPAPFGNGRPGWHIECSAMSQKFLGPHFDLHMGGVDNIFPHHENEIAQSEAVNGQTFVNYWLHCQHLIVDSQKMSKSLGNFFTLRDVLAKGFQPAEIRYLLLSTHYRKLLNFSFDGLERARQTLHKINDFIFMLRSLPLPDGKAAAVTALIAVCQRDFEACMDDDFNISGALGAFFEFMHQVNLIQSTLKQGDQAAILQWIERVNSVLGVVQTKEQGILDSAIEEKIGQRDEARKRKDFKMSDAIRDELKAAGIILIDTPAGCKWKRDE